MDYQVYTGERMSIKNIKKTLLPVFEKYGDQVVFSYLFGSAAREKPSPLSDIDIAVYLSKNNSRDFFELKLSLHADICRALGRNDVDIVVLNTAVNLMLLDDIIRNGIVLHDGEIEAREAYEGRVIHQAIDFKAQRFAIMGM